MTIISLKKINGTHQIQSQSHRTSVWLDGYIEVPDSLVNKAFETCGYCDIIIVDGILTDIIPTEKPVIVEPLTAEEERDIMLADLEYRTILLELGV